MWNGHNTNHFKVNSLVVDLHFKILDQDVFPLLLLLFEHLLLALLLVLQGYLTALRFSK